MSDSGGGGMPYEALLSDLSQAKRQLVELHGLVGSSQTLPDFQFPAHMKKNQIFGGSDRLVRMFERRRKKGKEPKAKIRREAKREREREKDIPSPPREMSLRPP
jgi:hypothetical protein